MQTSLTPSSSVGRIPSLKEAIDSYIKYFAASRQGAHLNKRRDMHLLMEFAVMKAATKAHHVPLSILTHSNMQEFVDWRLEAGDKPSTAARRLGAVKHFCARLCELIPGFRNPAKTVRAPMAVQGPPEYLDREGQLLVLEKSRAKWESSGKFVDLQMHMIIRLILVTGLRLEEVRSVRMSQVDGEWLRNVKCKGRKFRDIYLPGGLREDFEFLIQKRENFLRAFNAHYDPSLHAALPIFVSSYKANLLAPDSFRLCATHIWRKLKDLDPVIHPHLFRHTFAQNFLSHTGDIRLVSQALGHSDVKITMRYTERKAEDLARALESMTA